MPDDADIEEQEEMEENPAQDMLEPRRGPGRPKGSKTKQVAVNQANAKQEMVALMLRMMNYYVRLPTSQLAKQGRSAFLWLEAIDGALNCNLFPKKGKAAIIKNNTLHFNPQTLKLPPPIQKLQVCNPQPDDFIEVEQGGGGCPQEGGIAADAPSEGHSSEKFSLGDENSDGDECETDT